MLPVSASYPLLFTSTNVRSPPPPPAGWRGNLSNEDFDTNLVIILAAFLLAAVIILGLNSVTLCIRRATVDNFHEAMRHPGPAGLKKSDLSQIPVAVYKPGEAISATDCPICLGEFMDGEQVRVLPKCNHGYHVKCIDPWIMAHSACPTCRQPLIDRPLPGPAAMQAVFRSPDNEPVQPSTVVVVISC